MPLTRTPGVPVAPIVAPPATTRSRVPAASEPMAAPPAS